MQSVCLYLGSSPGARPEYEAVARSLATTLAQRNMTLVYGGGNVGLMGIAANAALEAGGKVIGVIPADIADKEVGHLGLTDLQVVDSMHERKMRMSKLADGIIADAVVARSEAQRASLWALREGLAEAQAGNQRALKSDTNHAFHIRRRDVLHGLKIVADGHDRLDPLS